MTSKQFDPSVLFDCPNFPAPYGSMADELNAVGTGQKGMAYYALHQDTVVAGEPPYDEILETAGHYGLTVVHLPIDGRPAEAPQALHIFVVSPHQLWRIPAFLINQQALREHEFCAATEYSESRILGYSDEETRSWMQHLRQERVGWLGMTMYALLPESVRNCIAELNYRCFPLEVRLEAIVPFMLQWREGGLPTLRQRATTLLPPRTSLSRFAVETEAFQKIFKNEPTDGDPFTVMGSLATLEIKDLNNALLSRIEILSSEGTWA